MCVQIAHSYKKDPNAFALYFDIYNITIFIHHKHSSLEVSIFI